jgi:hypothetical protein
MNDMSARSTLAVAAAATLLASATAASAATCKTHPHMATGSPGAVQYFASLNAKYAWKSSVAKHDGGAFDTWSLAKDKRVACKKSAPGNNWVCSAKARPCSL